MNNSEEINKPAEARHRVLELLRAEALLCAVERSPLAVFAVGQDNFEALAQADAARASAELLHGMEVHCGRQRDRICRLSDSVIVAICPKTLPAGAHHVATRIRETAEFLHTQGRFPQITLSIGIAVAVPSGADSAESLLARAEYSLKSAQESGGNRIVGAVPPAADQAPKTVRSFFSRLFGQKTPPARQLED